AFPQDCLRTTILSQDCGRKSQRRGTRFSRVFDGGLLQIRLPARWRSIIWSRRASSPSTRIHMPSTESAWRVPGNSRLLTKYGRSKRATVTISRRESNTNLSRAIKNSLCSSNSSRLIAKNLAKKCSHPTENERINLSDDSL